MRAPRTNTEETVSAIITTHNRPEELWAALASVQDQTQAPTEVIVVDDASDPPLFATKVQDWFPDLPISVERNDVSQGPGGARNRGVALASGDILMFLDDDDTWEPTKIYDQAKVFAENAEVGLVYSGRKVVTYRDRSNVKYTIDPVCQGDIYPGILISNCIGVTSSVAIRRSVFEAVEGFDENLAAREDYEMWIRCARQTSVAHDDGHNLRYTIVSESGTQMSSSHVKRHITAIQQIMDKHREEMDRLPPADRDKAQAEYYYYVAKMARKHGVLAAVPWVVRSLRSYPMKKVVAALLPPPLVRTLRSISG